MLRARARRRSPNEEAMLRFSDQEGVRVGSVGWWVEVKVRVSGRELGNTEAKMVAVVEAVLPAWWELWLLPLSMLAVCR